MRLGGEGFVRGKKEKEGEKHGIVPLLPVFLKPNTKAVAQDTAHDVDVLNRAEWFDVVHISVARKDRARGDPHVLKIYHPVADLRDYLHLRKYLRLNTCVKKCDELV